MTNRKRLAAVVFAVLVLFAMTTSLFVVAHEANHDCSGENCPVCAFIAVCRDTLKAFCAVLALTAAVFACFRIASTVSAPFYTPSFNQTPVSLKVKLLN